MWFNGTYQPHVTIPKTWSSQRHICTINCRTWFLYGINVVLYFMGLLTGYFHAYSGGRANAVLGRRQEVWQHTQQQQYNSKILPFSDCECSDVCTSTVCVLLLSSSCPAFDGFVRTTSGPVHRLDYIHTRTFFVHASLWVM